MNPLDLRGPEFLSFYLLGGVAALVWHYISKLMVRGPSGSLPASVLQDLHPYEVAYLASGATGALDAALASLAHRGMIELDSSSGHDTLQLVKNEPPYSVAPDGVFRGIPRQDHKLHPLDHEICKHLAERTSFYTLRQNLADITRKLEDGLVQRGLYMSPGTHRFRTFSTNMFLWALVALGTAKIGVGILRLRPVSLLVILVIITTVLALALPRISRRTRRGDAAIDTLTMSNAALGNTASTAPEQLHADEAALACGLFGGAVLGGSLAALGASMVASQPSPAWSSGGDSGFTCGSSCGGGCGGGCGGCGGCGG